METASSGPSGSRGAALRLRAPTAVAFGVLLVLFAARLDDTARRKTFTMDEPHYVGTALYLWESGDYHFARSLRYHPPLAFHLAGLPLLALDLEGLPVDPAIGGRLVRGEGPPPDRVRHLSRLPFVALACWGAVLVFAWSRELAGDAAGLLAMFVYTFSPQILAHGSLVHSDVTVTVLYLQTLYAFWRWRQRPGPLRFALCGVSLGLALLAKLSALLLLPSLALMQLVLVLRGGPEAGGVPGEGLPARLARAGGALAGLGLVALGVIWLGYGGSFAWAETSRGPLAGWTLPGYLHCLGLDVAVNTAGRRVFFLGEIHPSGRWYFLPVAFALKTPLAFVALGVAALVRRPDHRRDLGLFLGIPIAVYAAVAVFWLRVPLGLRYVLPLYPLLHVFVGVRLGPAAAPLWRGGVLAACAGLAFSSLAIHPHYLACFNALAGGPENGYRHLVDANLDWGQDLATLGRFLREQGNPPVHLAYFGVEKPERYGVRAIPLRGCEPVTGWVAVSATYLQGLYDTSDPFRPAPEGCFDWLREHEPVAQPGYSILVYRIPGAPEPGVSPQRRPPYPARDAGGGPTEP